MSFFKKADILCPMAYLYVRLISRRDRQRSIVCTKTRHWLAQTVETISYSAHQNKNFMQRRVSKTNQNAAQTAAKLVKVTADNNAQVTEKCMM